MNDDSHQSPNWSLLPAQPRLFFGLPDQYDLRELKRSYGKLIKQFKPEQHPDEFQKIRAAYEALRTYIQFEQKFNVNSIESLNWNSIELLENSETNTGFHSTVPDQTSPLPSRLDLCETLKNGTSFSEVYASLIEQEHKTEQDYFSLAVLSDLTETQESESFLDWLIRGTNNLAYAPQLRELLLEYCQHNVADDQLEEVISDLAIKLKPHDFTFISLPLWLQLIRSEFGVRNSASSHGRFVPLWRKISTLPKLSIEQSVFYLAVQILRALVVLERGEGCRDIEYFLDSDPQFFDQYLDFEREFAEVIKYFIAKSQKDFRYESQNDFVYKLIIDYCIYDDKLEVFNTHRKRLEHDLPAVLNTYPTSYNKYHQLLNEVISWIMVDAGQHLEHQSNLHPRLEDFGPDESEFEEVESTFWWKHVNRVLFSACMFGCMLLMQIVAFSVLGQFQTKDTSLWFLVSIFSVLLGLCVGYYVHIKYGELKRQRMIRDRYLASWRLKFCNEALNYGLNWQDVEHLLNQPTSENQSPSTARSRFYRLVRVDPAIQFITTLFPNWIKR